jgi:hypothetical protein
MPSKQFNSVDGYAIGNANVIIDSNGNVAGNVITATANITAPQLISNVANGTAPLTVTSTTRVANLNVAQANVADLITVSAGTGNNFLIFANAATGNIAELTSTGLTANLSNNSITATTFVGALSGAATSATTAGTVTTAAQPNITSVGTLTSLGVNGTVTAVAFTANTGVFTGNGSGLSALSASNISSGTLAQARLANSNVILGSTTLTLGTTTTTIAGLSSVTSTTFVGSLTGAATTAGTVTTAAQPNITSVGTLTSLTTSGNLTFNGIGQRILGDFSNATINSRVAFQSSTANTNTVVHIIPNGTGTVSTLSMESDPAMTNGQFAQFALVANTDVRFLSSVRGTGSFVPITFYTSNTERIRIDTGGNVGIGTTSPLANIDIRGNTRIQSNIAYVSPNGANTINSQMLNGGTLSWSGNAGQLFSITDSMTGNIFTVNDVSGIPMISVDAGGNIQFAASGGFVSYGVTTGITAAGSTQATATALTRPINVVSTVSASTGVILPAVPAGARVIVMNTSGTALNTYPPSGAAINSAATNAAYSMPAGTRLEFISVSATQWYTMNATYG